MANTDYKSPDALMRHLRDNGISISGRYKKTVSFISMKISGIDELLFL